MEPTKKQLHAMATRLMEDRDPLGESERAIRLLGDYDESELEEAETRDGDQRDVIKDIPGLSGNERVLPDEDQLPEGMETAVRGTGQDSDDVRVAGEDQEA